MAEKKGVGHAYNVDFLNVVFAASSLFLFLSVVWMVWDDFDREWKNTQRQFAAARDAGDAGAARSRRRARSTRTSWRSSRRSSKAAQQNVAANQAKVDELQEKLEGRRHAAVPRDGRLPVREGDLRPGSLRLRGARAPTDRRADREEAEALDDEAKRLDELNLAREKADAEKAAIQKQLGAVHRQGRRRCRSRSTTCSAEQNAPAQAARRHRAERGQGLLPERAAARLHGADDQDPADHPAERRRRRELHPRAEDGSVPDLPPGDRQEGLREIPAAVHDAPAICELYLGGSSPHPIDKIGCTVCHEGMGQSVSFRDAAHTPSEREAEGRVGEEVPLGAAAPVGLPDAADEHDGGIVREVPQAAGLRSRTPTS